MIVYIIYIYLPHLSFYDNFWRLLGLFHLVLLHRLSQRQLSNFFNIRHHGEHYLR